MTERELNNNIINEPLAKQLPYMFDKDEAQRVIKFSNFSFFITGESNV